MSTIDKLVLDSDSSDAFIRRLMSSVVLATKESNSLPQGSDYQYHAISPDFRDSAKSASNEAKSLIQQICAYVMPNESFNMSDDMADSALYEHVVDVIDSLLEGADQCLDQSKPKASNVANTVNQSLTLDKDRLLTQANRNIPKPQLDFYTTIDNMRSTSFRPRLTTKYHATVPLDDRPRRLEVSGEEDEVVGTVGPDEYFPHPYEAELRTLQHPSWCVNGKDVKNVSPTPTYSQNAFKYVDNDSDFEQMLRSLTGLTELAVDLEHHSYYTFLGLTCVMQISSRKQDFIVDTLALRRRMPELGVLFADPKIVKVLHGCDKDVLWLQRDLGLYLVNCFDTHVAAKALSYPALSLAHLLKMHCGVNADKKHQLSDWRLRPLTPEMLHYAKEDTHYLLYVYDRLRQELWKKLGQAGLEQVFSASKQLCLTRYEKPRFNPLGYRDLFRETASSRSIPKLDELSSLQDAALRSLWDWRDRMARQEDDSCAALVSNAELLRIGVHLPQTGVQLEQLCGPLSPFTRKHTADILRIVSEATSFGPSGGALKAASGAEGDTFASPSTKKSKIGGPAISIPPTEGAVIRSALPDSVYTFTPAIVTPKVLTGRVHAAPELPSPVLKTDEIFKQAGWNTPKIKTDIDSPLQFDAWQRLPSISEENRHRMERSREELAVAFDARLKQLATRIADEKSSAAEPKGKTSSRGPAPAAATHSDDENPAGGKTKQVDVGGVALEIPKTFEEVYQLSQRNRQRNKDKRRSQGAHAGEDEDEEMEEDGPAENEEDTSFTLKSGLHRMPNKDMAAGGGKKVDASFYTSGSDQPMDTGVDGTLELAQTLGWVSGAAEAAAVRDAHFQDLSHQQAAIDSGGAGSSADDASTGMRSERTAGSGPKKNRDSARPGKGGAQQSGDAGRLSGEGIAALGQDGSKQRAPIKAFDYSKLPHTGMGALATNSAGAKEDGKKGGKQQKGNNKNRNSADAAGSNPSLNPYMFGATLGK